VRKRRTAVVVDTNVTVIANGKENVPLACSAACATALHDITKSAVLAIDEGGLIFNEYKGYLSFAGQPGAGDYFFKWLADNCYRPERVARVRLEPDAKRPDEFAAFPADPELVAFDRSDRKFVAVALTHSERPPILNAVDSDWWDFREALKANGVAVQFLCGAERFAPKA
jgi:hypothetical protein